MSFSTPIPSTNTMATIVTENKSTSLSKSALPAAKAPSLLRNLSLALLALIFDFTGPASQMALFRTAKQTASQLAGVKVNLDPFPLKVGQVVSFCRSYPAVKISHLKLVDSDTDLHLLPDLKLSCLSQLDLAFPNRYFAKEGSYAQQDRKRKVLKILEQLRKLASTTPKLKRLTLLSNELVLNAYLLFPALEALTLKLKPDLVAETQFDLTELPRLTNLRFLSLEGGGSGDYRKEVISLDPSQIRELPLLQEVEIDNISIKETASFSNCPELRKVTNYSGKWFPFATETKVREMRCHNGSDKEAKLLSLLASQDRLTRFVYSSVHSFADPSVLEKCTQLEEIEIDTNPGSLSTKLDISFLAKLPVLREVNLSLNPSSCQALTGCKALRRLTLDCPQRVELELPEVGLDTGLFSLNYRGGSLSKTSLANIADQRHLRELSLGGRALPVGTDISALGELSNLLELSLYFDIERSKFSNRDLDWSFLSSMSSLRKVTISGYDGDLSPFENIPVLTHLTLIRTVFTTYGTVELAELRDFILELDFDLLDLGTRENFLVVVELLAPKLEKFCIAEVSQSTTCSIELTEPLPQLREFTLEAKLGTIRGLELLPQLKTLRLLDWYDGHTWTDLSFLAPCSSLERLVITDTCDLTDISVLASFTKLRCLYLANLRLVTDLSPLLACSKLEELYLFDCPIQILHPLQNLSKTVNLLVDGVQVTNVATFRKVNNNWSTVTKLRRALAE